MNLENVSQVSSIITTILGLLGAIGFGLFKIGKSLSKLENKDTWLTDKSINNETQVGSLWQDSARHAKEIDENKVNLIKTKERIRIALACLFVWYFVERRNK